MPRDRGVCRHAQLLERARDPEDRVEHGDRPFIRKPVALGGNGDQFETGVVGDEVRRVGLAVLEVWREEPGGSGAQAPSEELPCGRGHRHARRLGILEGRKDVRRREQAVCPQRPVKRDGALGWHVRDVLAKEI